MLRATRRFFAVFDVSDVRDVCDDNDVLEWRDDDVDGVGDDVNGMEDERDMWDGIRGRCGNVDGDNGRESVR